MRACMHVGAVWLTNLPSLLVTMLSLHASLGGVAHRSIWPHTDQNTTHAYTAFTWTEVAQSRIFAKFFWSFKYFSYLGLFSYDLD